MQPEPGSPAPVGLFNGEAVTLWRLRRGNTRIDCFVAEWPGAYWLAVECAGGELLASQTLATLDEVMTVSDAERSTWIADGWTED